MKLKQKAISGVKWNTASTFTVALFSLLKISILTRFLEKGDFGLMALVMFVLGFTNIFVDMGLTTAILHKQKISKNEFSSLYWLNVGFSIILYVLILLIAPVFSRFYEETELINLIPIMGVNILLSGFGRQFKTVIQKALRFKLISIVNIISATISLIISIVLSFKGYGVYALVFAALGQEVVSNMLFIIFGRANHGVSFFFSYQLTKPFLKIGGFQVGGQIVNYFNRDIDTLIVGKFFGVEILGGYNLAKQLVFRPASILNPIITNVSAPILAKLQDDLEVLKKNYLKLVNIIATINIPIYILVIVFAPFIVRIMYGEGFDNIVSLVRILSVYMMYRAIGNPIGSLVIATGKTHLEFVWNLVILFFMPLAVFIGSQFTIEAVAFSIVICSSLLFIPSWYMLVKKMIGASLKEYVKSLKPNFNVFFQK
ncbi:MOP flippase family protein [uncultured Tenacibaculum sp.]|uniref:MOP flippase family protein n=1 Tax=uncultured Tenacibaculum sp. TaxID=174713 RepID=UPI002630DA52|nr:MOP flippase family protein [uncultured Tenacibaculum sp.]